MNRYVFVIAAVAAMLFAGIASACPPVALGGHAGAAVGAPLVFGAPAFVGVPGFQAFGFASEQCTLNQRANFSQRSRSGRFIGSRLGAGFFSNGLFGGAFGNRATFKQTTVFRQGR